MLSISYIGLIIFIIFLELVREKETKIDFLTLFNIVYSLCYPLPAMILTIAGNNNLNSTIVKGTIIDINNIQIPIAIFATYLLIIAGFHAKSAQFLARKIHIKLIANEEKIVIYSLLLLLLSCLSIYIYSSQFGGLLFTLSNTALLRSTVIEAGSLSFVKRFILFSFMGSYLLASLLFIRKFDRFVWPIRLFFLLSVFISILSFFLIATRAIILRYVVVFYMAYVLKTKNLRLIIFIAIAAVCSIFVVYGKEILGSLLALPEGIDAVINKFQYFVDSNNKSNIDLFRSVDEFSFPFYSIYAAVNAPYKISLMSDWLNGFASFIPDRIFEAPPTVSHHNTYNLIKSYEYEIPSGFISSCLYSMSWPGLIIYSIFYGWVGRYLQCIILNHLNKIYWMYYVFAMTALVWVDYTAYADPKIFLQTHFWFLFSTCILLLFSTRILILSK